MKREIARTRTPRRLAIVVVTMLLGAVVSNAGPITYQVNRTIGVGSVTGAIQSDGTLGVFTAGNIIDWNLVLNDGSHTFNLTGPASGNNSFVFVAGNDVTASATQLLFNFSGVDAGYLLFEVLFGSGQNYYCDGASNQNFVCLPGESDVPLSVFAPGYINIAQTGNQVIGTARTTGVVPEPGTYGLMLTGCLSLTWLYRRRTKHAISRCLRAARCSGAIIWASRQPGATPR